MEKSNRTIVSIEMDVSLAQKIESTFLQSKMKLLRQGIKVSKKAYYSFVLSKGIADFNNEELIKFIEKTAEKA